MIITDIRMRCLHERARISESENSPKVNSPKDERVLFGITPSRPATRHVISIGLNLESFRIIRDDTYYEMIITV